MIESAYCKRSLKDYITTIRQGSIAGMAASLAVIAGFADKPTKETACSWLLISTIFYIVGVILLEILERSKNELH